MKLLVSRESEAHVNPKHTTKHTTHRRILDRSYCTIRLVALLASVVDYFHLPFLLTHKRKYVLVLYYEVDLQGDCRSTPEIYELFTLLLQVLKLTSPGQSSPLPKSPAKATWRLNARYSDLVVNTDSSITIQQATSWIVQKKEPLSGVSYPMIEVTY